MVFSSVFFLIYFLPVVLGVYLLLPKSFKNSWILISSLGFYSWGAPTFVFILLGSTIIDFFAVHQMAKSEGSRRKAWLLFSLCMNLGLLLYFKYANFFVENINFGLETAGMDPISWTKVILPIGISFYTFQTLTYIIDVYKKDNKPQEKLHNYLMYIFLFPQMIAGPIITYRKIVKQITERTESASLFLSGFVRFSVGLAKKVLIANVIGHYAHDLLYPPPGVELITAAAWLGILAYTFQIYFDFSGYSDMAIGIGKMFGFKFPENFDRPYTSYSISNFWRKWHITLGDFMKNYLYIPLGGNKSSALKMYRNLMIVFLLSGLWHGSHWTFIIWGIYHGLWLILDRLFLEKMLKRVKWLAIPFTFFVVVNGWALFFTKDLNVALHQLEVMWIFKEGSIPILAHQNFFHFYLLLAAFFCVLGFLPFIRKISDKFVSEKLTVSGQLVSVSTAALLFLVSLANVISTDFNPFIYFQF